MRRLSLPLLAILIGIAPLSAASAAVVYPPGLRIGLEPAGELSVSRRFPGFEDAARQVAVTILDLPAAAFDQLSRSAFAPQTQELTTSSAKASSLPAASAFWSAARRKPAAPPCAAGF